jgi:DNA-binding PadR family transcriptional regulator
MYWYLEVAMFNQHFHEFGSKLGSFGRPNRLFRKGDMKYVILDLLKDKPAHGYELTQALEERFNGFYSPSAGSVYPVLQLLEDMEYVTSNVTESKKIYTITEAGKKFLEEQKKITEEIKGRLHDWLGEDNREYLKEARTTLSYGREIAQVIKLMAFRRESTKLARVNEILAKTLKDMEQIYQEK